jgi:hypothetical protein
MQGKRKTAPLAQIGLKGVGIKAIAYRIGVGNRFLFNLLLLIEIRNEMILLSLLTYLTQVWLEGVGNEVITGVLLRLGTLFLHDVLGLWTLAYFAKGGLEWVGLEGVAHHCGSSKLSLKK